MTPYKQTDAPYAQEAAMITETMQRAATAVGNCDVEGLKVFFYDGPDTFLFDYYKPRAMDLQAFVANFEGIVDQINGSITFSYLEIHPHVLSPDAAWSWAIQRVAAKMKDGSSIDFTCRVTDIWRKINSRWQAVGRAVLPSIRFKATLWGQTKQ